MQFELRLVDTAVPFPQFGLMVLLLFHSVRYYNDIRTQIGNSWTRSL